MDEKSTTFRPRKWHLVIDIIRCLISFAVDMIATSYEAWDNLVLYYIPYPLSVSLRKIFQPQTIHGGSSPT